jgi:hypothetical protein
MSDRSALVRRVAPAVVVLALAGAWLLPGGEGLRLESGDASIAERWDAQLGSLPADAVVLVGFDPDLGTYPEIRPTVRVMIADLLNRDARLAFVSLTPEGRALGLAELARMDRLGVNPTRIADLGYLPGAEAALVSLTRTLPAAAESHALARRLAEGGIGEVSAILAIGGNDLGPRSWVEQVAPRVPDVPILAVAPTVLLPELQPYLGSGQLGALVATPRDGAAYRSSADPGALERLATTPEPAALPVLVGIVIALLVLGQSIVVRPARPRPDQAAEPR